jgi:hypothetical protein
MKAFLFSLFIVLGVLKNVCGSLIIPSVWPQVNIYLLSFIVGSLQNLIHSAQSV